jgi:hypothetical protein
MGPDHVRTYFLELKTGPFHVRTNFREFNNASSHGFMSFSSSLKGARKARRRKRTK